MSLQTQVDALSKERDTLQQSNAKLSKDNDQFRSDVTRNKLDFFIIVVSLCVFSQQTEQKLSSLRTQFDALTAERDAVRQAHAKLTTDHELHRTEVSTLSIERCCFVALHRLHIHRVVRLNSGFVR